ncbi:tRNA (adenosine(37)-N6)-threonylcarbamoyltransferase complex ATPase subunit type 1 TsaE [Asaia lannensis]|uniref:tRNA threonylcarbamoyladenosine biosynthesis protein TsaE n=1 Tax=Asaia lannensis NBRC 102526 TaxID=1307926 RepID=A0ABT1CCK9_9PROT|nr:tRNA (adenosine(37)-N6)-threonylcarbamoyltransferase complex ATPase subunit type 1 TsaE [Asaia lannensis]MCO6158598.1 tRNA (adenosine(37)-N6)-threonylcarbamoyltransferase complex ATPase subunit type 1 TsaE [Asaia lannensis NBRC 102526]GBR00705.1 ATP/GTP hydrolase [Asaia lannensis NBRC 102526]
MTELDLPDQPATEALAARLAALSGAGDVIALHGEMGMGKSVFARAFLRALAGDPSLEVPSPTFSLVQIYDLPKATVAHFDLWRLDGPDALFELGWDEVQEGIMLVEWPERAGDELPRHALHLTLMPGEGEEGRRVILEGWSDRL